MTEGNGHVIDPNGDARRALYEAVAEHGPEALSNAVIMDNVCWDHLSNLPGESILIGSAARTDVPALLRNLIPRLGNYGAIQSAAVTLAEEHELDLPACVWVVREFARALGHIAPGPATGGSGSLPGPGPRPVSGDAPRPGPAPVSAAGLNELTAQVGVAPAGAGEGGAAEAAEPEGAGSAGSASKTPWNETTGSETTGSETTGAAGAGSESAGSAGRGAGAGGGASPSAVPVDGNAGSAAGSIGTAEAGHAEGSRAEGNVSAGEAAATRMAAGGVPAGGDGRAVSASFASSGSRGGGPEGPWRGPPPGGAPWGGPGGGAGSPGGPGLPPQGPGGTGVSPPGGMPGSPSGGPPGRRPEGSRVFNRNTLGIAAAIALVAGYLGVAAAAHLSPFPASTVAATPSQSPSTGNAGTSTGTSTSASPNGSPDASPDVSPKSDYQILLAKIPSVVRGQSSCPNAGTMFGATAVSQCDHLHGLGAGIIVYYLFPSPAALATGFSNLLKKATFRNSRECTTNGKFTDFLINCKSDFTSATPNLKGSIAEYTNTSNQPLIVTSDSRQNVMVVLVGTNDADLLAYWRQLKWVVP